MNMRTFGVMALLSLLLVPASAGADLEGAGCSEWQAMPFAGASGPNGADGAIEAITEWDPDGGGPRPAMLVVAGDFTHVQGVAANNIAARDPSTGQWQALGTGTDDQIRALTVFNGELIAGGLFTHAGGQSVQYIARWNGTAWQSLGSGTGSFVYALWGYGGELIAGGYFTSAGGATANHVARWNGSLWQPLGSGINDWVVSLSAFNGELIAGGYFSVAGGVAANRIARWNGSIWQAMGSGMNAEVLSLGVVPGALAAGGRFTIAGGVATSRVARWNGSSWQALGSGMDGAVLAVTTYQGEMIAGGAFLQAGGVNVGGIARWTGSAWQALDLGLIGSAYALYPQTELIVGGSFTEAGASPAANLASWNGIEWGSFGGGSGNSVSAMTLYNGRVIAGGDFQQSTAHGPPAHFLAAWDGAAFSTYGTSMDSPVYSLLAFSTGGPLNNSQLIAGGLFLHAGGVAATRVARWLQSDVFFPPPAWEAMGAGFNNVVYALERHGGATYAGGAFTFSSGDLNRIGRWNESSDVWEALGTGMNGTVLALKSYGGFLYAGGSFTTAGGVATGGLARWNGSAWSLVGGFFQGTVYALEVHNGQLVMAGSFPGINSSPNLAQWNGSTYSTFGTGGTNATVRSLKSTGARLYVGGEFTTAGGVAANHIAYWDGSWHDVAGGADSYVYAMASFHDELHAGGAFGNVAGGSIFSPRWAKFAETGIPWIVSQPSGRTAFLGETVTFTIGPAAGYGGLTYRWYRDATPLINGATLSGSTIGGATSKTLTITNLTYPDYGNYWLRLSNACGSDTSALAQLAGPAGVSNGMGGTLFEALGPNPARGLVTLAFSLAREADVRFLVHDVTGRRVREIGFGRLVAGRHQTRWDGRDGDGRRVRAGLYFVRLEVDGRRLGVRRLTILR